MPLGKKLSAFLLGILLLLDALIAYRLFDRGWPKYVKAGPSDALQIVRVPFTWQDALIVLGMAVLHLLVIYTFRKSRIVPARQLTGKGRSG